MFRSTDQGRVRVLPPDRAGAQKAFNEHRTSLVETKRTIVAAYRRGVESAREAEHLVFARLTGQPSELEAFTALAGRSPQLRQGRHGSTRSTLKHRTDIEGN
jgi:hypothetical protein